MKTLRILLTMIVLGSFLACNSGGNLLDQISKLEREVYSGTTGIDKEKGAELVSLYLKYADANKSDSLAPGCIYKAAELSININNSEDAIMYFDRVIEEYPDFQKVPDAIFIKAFVYEVQFQNLNKARETYQLFLQRYPEHLLAHDAQISLNNLGKTPEQILLEAREKATADSLAAMADAS